MVASFYTRAQQMVLATVHHTDTSYLSVSDSFEVARTTQENIRKLRKKGHLAASIDSIFYSSDTLWQVLYIGPTYTTLHINSHNIGTEYISQKKHLNMTISSFERLQKQLITTHENTGYPFAQLFLQDNYTQSDTLFTTLFFDPYIHFEYDTIAYNGRATLSKKYLAKYLDIQPGQAYNEIAVATLDKKLRNLPLIRVAGSSRVLFIRGKAQVVLQIEDVITDRIDGVIGLAPNSENGTDNQLLITGEVNIELNNLFQSGKQLELHWRNYLKNSQKLDASFTYPYLLNTKLGVSSEFNLNKFDTLFVNLKGKFSLRYQQQGNNYLEVYYQNISSNLLNADTSRIRTTKAIPTNNPYRIGNYGLAVFQQDLDYMPNPRKGYRLLADVAIGQKQILPHAEIRQVTFANTENATLINVYDTVQLRSTRLDVKISSSYFIPIKARSTLRQVLTFNGLFSQNLFFNELYNFGGNATLRGFDENELFASKALTYLLEYRYLIGENSNVGLFANTAFVENTIESDRLVNDIPYGFGASANIQVGKGILNLAYALGSQQGNALQLSAAKFHFGVINYF